MQQPSIARRATEQPPHAVKYHYADTFWCIYVTSVVSACIAELATYPLDLTKTRLQIQGEALTENLNNAKMCAMSKLK